MLRDQIHRCALQARKTANLLARVYSSALEPLGLEISQFSTLAAVALERSDSVTELAGTLGVERSTLARNLRVSERDGLIVRSERQGRRSMHRLTSKGRRMLLKALPLWDEAQARFSVALSNSSASELDPHKSLRLLHRAARTFGSAVG
jgi:DNA-binding MarR family transcriptional regulator